MSGCIGVYGTGGTADAVSEYRLAERI